ncbi:hypothetical protein BJ508DRAFT_304806 [Ascobolus immersus RN42]|uniref:Uncharacterized protein n=1 Tax=Ascobolus immersus RN42 TaxID=1160509 RepID=A0A3N4IB87_ASCIM|nr:hypothetical protein BJ508DRAFT_304806 [Ascobolus immersus RN42]
MQHSQPTNTADAGSLSSSGTGKHQQEAKGCLSNDHVDHYSRCFGFGRDGATGGSLRTPVGAQQEDGGLGHLSTQHQQERPKSTIRCSDCGFWPSLPSEPELRKLIDDPTDLRRTPHRANAHQILTAKCFTAASGRYTSVDLHEGEGGTNRGDGGSTTLRRMCKSIREACSRIELRGRSRSLYQPDDCGHRYRFGAEILGFQPAHCDGRLGAFLRCAEKYCGLAYECVWVVDEVRELVQEHGLGVFMLMFYPYEPYELHSRWLRKEPVWDRYSIVWVDASGLLWEYQDEKGAECTGINWEFDEDCYESVLKAIGWGSFRMLMYEPSPPHSPLSNPIDSFLPAPPESAMQFGKSSPPAGVWQILDARGRETVYMLLSSWSHVDRMEKARRLIELFLVIIALDLDDFGSSTWRYGLMGSGCSHEGVEDVSLACFDAYMRGRFSSDRDGEKRVEGQVLCSMKRADLCDILQITKINTLDNIDEMLHRVQRLGRALTPVLFGNELRLGNIVDYLTHHPTTRYNAERPIAMLVPTAWDVLFPMFSRVLGTKFHNPDSRHPIHPTNEIELALLDICLWATNTVVETTMEVLGLNWSGYTLLPGLPSKSAALVFKNLGIIVELDGPQSRCIRMGQ